MKVNEDFLYIIVNCISKEAATLPSHGPTKGGGFMTPRTGDRVSKPSTPRLIGASGLNVPPSPATTSVISSVGNGNSLNTTNTERPIISSSTTQITTLPSTPTTFSMIATATTSTTTITASTISLTTAVAAVATTPSSFSATTVMTMSSATATTSTSSSSVGSHSIPSSINTPSSKNTGLSPNIITTTSGGITGGTSAENIASSSTTLSPFDFIYSEKGFSNLKKWFSQNANGNKNQFNENQFITFLRELTDLGDHQILEVFDTFDHNHQGAISFNEFFLIISLLVARETGQTTRFLYLHGKEIFEVLMGKEGSAITFEEFSRLGFIIGLTEDQVFAILKDFNPNLFNLITYEDFMLYYYAVFDDWDKGRKAHQSSDVNNSSLSPTGSYPYQDKKPVACIIS